MSTSTATNVALTVNNKLVVVKNKVVRLPAAAVDTTYAPAKQSS